MKEKDVKVEYDPQQVVMFVEKEDGSYGPLQTGAYMAKNYLDDYFLKMDKLKKELTQQLKEGKISPISYYMVLQELSVAELALRVGVRRARVRKHLKPEYFKKIKPDLLEQYAEVFGVTVSNMVQMIENKGD